MSVPAPPEAEATPFRAPLARQRDTRVLLTLGQCAGPFVLVVGLVQTLTRPGFDWRRHAPSLLALGVHGWVQSANFVVAGWLAVALAFGAGRVLRGRSGGALAPWLLGVFAVSHILVGVFRTDPAFGFPPGVGAPEGAPSVAASSGSAILHSLFAFVGFNALTGAVFVLAWHFHRCRAHRGWVVASLALGLLIVAIDADTATWEAHHQGAARVGAPFDFRPLWALLLLVWSYLTALAWYLRRGLARSGRG